MLVRLMAETHDGVDTSLEIRGDERVVAALKEGLKSPLNLGDRPIEVRPYQEILANLETKKDHLRCGRRLTRHPPIQRRPRWPRSSTA